jgi:hypothetical protein
MAQLLLDAGYSGDWTWKTAGRRHHAISARRSFQITVPQQFPITGCKERNPEAY